MGVVLDSSVLIAAERGRFDLPALFRSRVGDPFFIAAITASELLHGVERADTPERGLKRSASVEGVLVRLPVIDFDLSIARRHAGLWAALEASGKLIGPHDMLIAKVFGCILFFIWVRWTLPRFRFDQLMALGWKVFFELALVNVILTAGILIWFPLK